MRYLSVLLVFLSVSCYGQTYHLLPDTCTYCSFVYSTDGTDFVQDAYLVSPNVDTVIMGNTYLFLPPTNEIYFGVPIVGVRQVGNKIWGAHPISNQEYLVQDWDAQIGDTIFDLYSNRCAYDAVFIAEDSTILNDGTYHRVREMKGIGYYPNGIYDSTTWTFFWQERGLCGEHVIPYFAIAGGLTFNLPDFNYGASYVSYYLPQAHTADWRYNKNDFMDSCDFIYSLTSLNENRLETLIVHPNPTSGKLDLGLLDFDVLEIQLIDIKANLLLKMASTNGLLDLSSFESGIYFLRVKSSDNVFRQAKIIKTE